MVGPIKGELKQGDRCDITQVALPAGVGIKLYTFTNNKHWDIPGVGQGQGACCKFNSTANLTEQVGGTSFSETCERTPNNLPDGTTNQVEYVGQFLPKEGKEGLFQFEADMKPPGWSRGASRRLLGAQGPRTGVCMYDLYILDRYQCATQGTAGNAGGG